MRGLVTPREGNIIIGSPFIAAGAHIPLDTFLRVAQLTKATLTMINCLCLVILLQNNATEEQSIGKEVQI